ncbi:hypothetical protein ACI6Q2_11720 [Chitinophagaceae bacterium LWZ2-11]
MDKKKFVESEKELMRDHLLFIRRISYNYLLVIPKGQDKFIRFIYCSVEKLHKSSLALLSLYTLLETQHDIEFPMGILLRTLLMDEILILHLRVKQLQISNDLSNLKEKTEEIKEEAYRFILDGTMHILDDLYSFSTKTEDQKKKVATKITKQFPGAFEWKKDTQRYKLVKKYNHITLANLIKNSKSIDLYNQRMVTDLYSYYSKYEHLSHWTSVLSNRDWAERLFNIHASIAMLVYSLKDLAIIGQLDDELNPYMVNINSEIDNYIRKSYPDIN